MSLNEIKDIPVNQDVIYVMGSDPTVRPLPDDLHIYEIFSKPSLRLYNPFNVGQPFRDVMPVEITFRTLQENRLVMGYEVSNIALPRSYAEQQKQDDLNDTMNAFWPAAKAVFLKQLTIPKRDMKIKGQDLDDFGLVISKPTRKIDKPSLKPRLTPGAR